MVKTVCQKCKSKVTIVCDESKNHGKFCITISSFNSNAQGLSQDDQLLDFSMEKCLHALFILSPSILNKICS